MHIYIYSDTSSIVAVYGRHEEVLSVALNTDHKIQNVNFKYAKKVCHMLIKITILRTVEVTKYKMHPGE